MEANDGASGGTSGSMGDAAALMAFAGLAAPVVAAPAAATTANNSTVNGELPTETPPHPLGNATSENQDINMAEIGVTDTSTLGAAEKDPQIETAPPVEDKMETEMEVEGAAEHPPENEAKKARDVPAESEAPLGLVVADESNTTGGSSNNNETGGNEGADVKDASANKGAPAAVKASTTTETITTLNEKEAGTQPQPMETSAEEVKATESGKNLTKNTEGAMGATETKDTQANDVKMQELAITTSSAKEESESKPSPKNGAKEETTTAGPAAADDNGMIELIENPPESLKKRTRSLEESLDRRKRRRRLRRMLNEAGEFPSFVALISAPPDDAIKEEEEDAAALKEEKEKVKGVSPEMIYIDVDEYLGLNAIKPESNRNNSNTSISANNNTVTARKAATPADEGYYEGRVIMAASGDEKYLSTLQIMIRDNLEYFSATTTDAAGSQSGRRHPIVQGKVGIRCIHCAKVALEHEVSMEAKLSSATVEPDKPPSAAGAAKNENFATDTSSPPKPMDTSRIWPPGSVSYPLNIAGLYSVCSQKPQLHFEDCPNMPSHIKAQFYRYVHEVGEARIKSREVTTPTYYAVAARRIGLVNCPGGMRYGRDLKLEPLPLESVLALERQENEEKKSQLRLPPPAVPEPSTVGSIPQSVTSSMPSDARRPADSGSEAVLAEALAQVDKPITSPARGEDKAFVSDYIFLCTRQMAICRAVPADLTTRGKKTKSMRVGFAGFCCRHCLKVREEVDGPELARAHGASDYSCRSFSSAPDNLASSISNSFALHLAKCANVPQRIRTALAAYKRSHAQHMSNLPYGSQSICFNKIYVRLRAADISEAAMMTRISKFKATGTVLALPPASASRPASNGKSSKAKQLGRGSPKFPVSRDADTARVLKIGFESLDPDVDNGLISPSDRELVSDYVFLTIRQLHVTLPTASDAAKRKPIPGISIMAGMCCLHCEKEDVSVVVPSGRAFPSAPDNYASSLNSSLYNHMQNCQFVPADIKKALGNLRRLHPQQIAHLKVGSQRRYFGKLYDRLRTVKVPHIPASAGKKSSAPSKQTRSSSRGASRGAGASSSRSRVTRGTQNGDDAVLTQFGFFEAPVQSFFCAHCRMVPLGFRARGSLSFARPTLEFLTEHSEVCKGDGFDLWFVVESLKKLLKTDINLDCMTDPLFKAVINESLGGNNDLTSIFTNELVKVYQMSRHGGVTRAVESYVKAKSEGLWCQFPRTISMPKVTQAFEKFAATKKDMSPQLVDHPALVSFLLLISPSMNMPSEIPEEDEDKDDEEEEDGEGSIEGESEGDNDAGDEGVAEEDTMEDGDDDEDFKAPASIKVVQKPKRGKELRRKKPPTETPTVDEDLDREVDVAEPPLEQQQEDAKATNAGAEAAAGVSFDTSKEEQGSATGASANIGAINVNENVNIHENDNMQTEPEIHTDEDALMKEGIDEDQEEDLLSMGDESRDMSTGEVFPQG